ncbi:MAG: phosphatidylserine decarboxylase [Proteobacteria bacterium]|nr:phosphatidylserine decarboxylase [Pseudomonadota bacterium]
MMFWQTITSVFPAIHREGHPFILIFAIVAIVLMLLWPPLGWIGVVMTVWCVYFFRDPERTTPLREGLTISPADGVVASVDFALPPPELEMGEGERQRIGIFMNVFNVHVNRSPADGTITKAVYTSGLFFNATLDKASEDNERMGLRMTTDTGKDIAFVQIAGLIARRIVCHVEEGEALKAGQRFGIIRFGSRVDVYLDDGMVPLVSVGQSTIAGETVIADEQANEVQRWGEIR